MAFAPKFSHQSCEKAVEELFKHQSPDNELVSLIQNRVDSARRYCNPHCLLENALFNHSYYSESVKLANAYRLMRMVPTIINLSWGYYGPACDQLFSRQPSNDSSAFMIWFDAFEFALERSSTQVKSRMAKYRDRFILFWSRTKSIVWELLHQHGVLDDLERGNMGSFAGGDWDERANDSAIARIRKLEICCSAWERY